MSTTHFPNGLTTTIKKSPLGEYIHPDPTQTHVYFQDFDRFVPGNWNITEIEVGTGSATEALTTGDGGVLLLTNAAALTDSIAMNLRGSSFIITERKTWFRSRISLSTNNAYWIMGLQIIDSTPKDVTNGVYLSSIKGTTDIVLTSEKDNVASSVTLTSEDFSGTFFDVGFYYDGKNTIQGYINNVFAGSLVIDDFPSVLLTPSFFVENATAAVNTMSVDYIFAAQER